MGGDNGTHLLTYFIFRKRRRLVNLAQTSCLRHSGRMLRSLRVHKNWGSLDEIIIVTVVGESYSFGSEGESKIPEIRLNCDL